MISRYSKHRNGLWLPGEKPPYGSRLIPGHPIGDSISALWILNEMGSLPIPFLRRNGLPIPTLTGVTWQNNRLFYSGTAARVLYAGAGISYAPALSSGTIFMLAHVATAANDSGSRGLVVFSASNGFPDGPCVEIMKWSDNNIYAGWYGCGAGDQRLAVNATGLWAAGDNISIALTWDVNASVKTELFCNSISLGQRTSALTTGSTAGYQIQIGNGGATSSAFAWSDQINFLFVADRALMSAEILSLHVDPYQMIEPEFTSRFYSIPAAGGGAFELDVDVGSYNISGTAANLFRSLKLTPAAGSYLLTGQSLSLLMNRKIVPGSGTYSYTGTVANLLAARKLVPALGSLTLTGTIVNLLATRKITPASGIYVITGTDVNLRRGRTLSVGVGNYDLTGMLASLRRDAKIVPATGIYDLTGTDATFIRGRIMSAASGVYGITGTALNLLFNRKIVPASGSYDLSGVAAGLICHRKITPASGSIILTGFDVDLTLSGLRHIVMTAGSGTYEITGGNVTFIYTVTGRIYILIADGGDWKRVI